MVGSPINWTILYIKVGNEYMKGGYVLVNCSGIDLTLGTTEQSISGIYAKVKKAYDTGKLVIAENLNWGGKVVTPVDTFIIDWGTYFICTASTLQIIVTNADKVTINNMVGG